MDIIAEYIPGNRQFYSAGCVYAHDSSGRVVGKPVNCLFLWDTGAVCSAISLKLARKLNLPRYPDSEFQGVAGSFRGPNCSAALVFRGTDGGLWYKTALLGTFPEPHIEGAQVIIGIDLILKGKLVIEKRDDKPVLTFSVDDNDKGVIPPDPE